MARTDQREAMMAVLAKADQFANEDRPDIAAETWAGHLVEYLLDAGCVAMDAVTVAEMRDANITRLQRDALRAISTGEST